MQRNDLIGLLIVDKPQGPTSHDVVDRVRQIIQNRRVGHTGTLDPMATGVLVLCVGKATRLAEYLTGHDKRYVARVRFGATTTTFDAEGEVLTTSATRPDRGGLELALARFRGRIEQRPPAYSAVRHNGQRAHQRARRGQPVALPRRPIEIHELNLLDFNGDEATLEVRCSAGTYIRSLAHDLGQLFGCGAHLSALRRTACGSFRVEDAYPLETLTGDATGSPHRWLRPPAEALTDWPLLLLDAELEKAIGHGKAIASPDRNSTASLWRACRADGTLVAVLRRDAATGELRPRKVLASA